MEKRTPYVTTKHFQVDLYDREGNQIDKEKKRIYSIEYTQYQDTVDLLPYCIHEGELYVTVMETLKPALLLRPSVATSMEGIQEPVHDCYILEQPSAVIQTSSNEYGILDTVKRLMRDKLPGFIGVGSPSILGGSYFPSVGTSTEIVFPRSLEVEPTISYVYTGTFSRVSMKKAQEVINLYCLQEKEVSTRLIELIFRLAEKKGIVLTVPLHKEELENYTIGEIAHKERFVEKKNLRSILDDEIPEGSSLGKVTIVETEKPRVPFLFTTHFRTEGVTTNKEKVPREVDVLIRKTVDSIDVGGYFICEGKLYMPIKWGVRPSLYVRNRMPHPVHTDVSTYFIEGIAGSLEGETSKEELLNRAILEGQEEVSLSSGGAPLYVGYDYPSAGHNIERVYRALLPLDPTKEYIRPQDAAETARVVYATVEDIITLSHEGVIRDGRLSLNAHIIKALHRGTSYEVPEEEIKKEDIFFENLVNTSSKVQEWLSSNAREVDEALSVSGLYRKLKTYGENELGVEVLTLTHDKETHFFSPMIPIFAVPTTTQGNKLPFYYLHDLFHYATTGFIPLTHKDGTKVLCSFEEYMRAVSGNECEAVWYSDVLIPQEFGIEEAENIFNGDSVARAFLELGIDNEEARFIIREIELKGIIPESVKLHPLFRRFLAVFVGRLLRYHVMDTDNNKSMYEYWKTHLDVAEVMEDFCDVFSSVDEYENYYKATINRITNYTEGVNPLRAYLSKLLNSRLRLLALKLAYIRNALSNVGDHRNEDTITSLLDRMKQRYKEVYANKIKLTSIDPTEKNKNIIAHARGVQEGLVQEVEKYIENLKNDESIHGEVRKNLQERTLPFFEPFAEINQEFLKEELARLREVNSI